MAVVLEQLQIQRKVVIGRYRSGSEYKKALRQNGCRIGTGLYREIGYMVFPGERKEIELASLSPADLDLGPRNAGPGKNLVLDEVFIRSAIEAGLEIPPLEVALELLLCSPEPLKTGEHLWMYSVSPFHEGGVHSTSLSREGPKSKPQIRILGRNEIHPSIKKLFVLPKRTK